MSQSARSALKLVAAFVAVSIAMLVGATPARAAPYVFKTRYATEVYKANLYLEAGAHEFYTQNISPGSDPVINVWDGTTAIAWNDDRAIGDRNARVAFTLTASQAGYYTLFIHAFRASTTGATDLVHVSPAGSTTYLSVPFGGDSVSMTHPSGSHRYETALSVGGVDDTVIYGIDCDGRIRASDDDGGVGLSSRLDGQFCNILVAAYAFSGNADLYVNDYTDDHDSDGLGHGLESELGTCDNSPFETCDAYTAVVLPEDTDRDGLSDSAEVFGVDDPSGLAPQYLPRWGASPRHKDVFVEIDWHSLLGSSNPFSPGDADQAQSFFSLGSVVDIRNPDGLDGVRLHLDIGTSYPGQTLYGDWGGANQVATTDVHAAAATNRNSVRNNIFHYGLMRQGGGGGFGQTPGQIFTWSGDTLDRRVDKFVHELGHNLNLQHHGHADWGSYNCKPNYASIMNYARPAGAAFSLGLNAVTLDPSKASELSSFPAVDPSYLAEVPYEYPVSGTSVDWNRDGVFADGASGYLRTAVTWAPRSSCASFSVNAQTLRTDAAGSARVMADTTPAIALWASRMYVFWVGVDGTISYYHAAMNGTAANGSCPGGGALGNACTSWAFAGAVPGIADARAVAAIEWNNSILLVYRNATGNLRSLHADWVYLGGALGGWSSVATIAAATTEPELSTVYVGSDEMVGVFYSDGVSYRWNTTVDRDTWTSRGVVVSDGVSLSGSVTPAVTPFPQRGTGSAAERTACGVFVDTADHPGFYCYSRADASWVKHPAFFDADGYGPPTVQGRPTLVFHVTRDDGGTPYVADAMYGQFYVYLPVGGVVGTDRNPQIFMTQRVSSVAPGRGAPQVTVSGEVSTQWDTLRPGTGLRVVEYPPLAAPKGVWLNGADGADTRMDFLPFLDGSVRATLKDGNDFRVMERGICLGVKPDSCGGRSAGYY